jgi:hypothetical protein
VFDHEECGCICPSFTCSGNLKPNYKTCECKWSNPCNSLRNNFQIHLFSFSTLILTFHS